MTLDEFFEGRAESRRLFEAVRETIESLGPVDFAVTKSQVAFRRARGFAWVWTPERYLATGAPLVLSIALGRRDRSPRWKQVVEPAPGRFMHHLELHDTDELDAEVLAWLAEARDWAGESLRARDRGASAT